MDSGVLAHPVPFGKYLLLEKISTGGMAEVYKAKECGADGFERLLAVKRILNSIAEDEVFISMFIDEAKIAGQLNHPQITQIFDLGKVDGSYFIAMEYVAGRDLRTIWERMVRLQERVDIFMVCYLIMRICEGLQYAHTKRDSAGHELHIVHRDVSPQNILLSYEGEVKLIDFGIAKAQNKTNETQVGVLKGKVSYMAPEQVRGLHIDHRADIFSLGIVLYEMLTLQRLFLGESDFDTLEKIRKVEMSPPTLYNPFIPRELEDIVLKALTKSPEDRFQDASEMRDALERFMRNHSAFYDQRDLGGYMRQAFAADVELERKKVDYYRTIRPEQFQTPAPVARGGMTWGEDENTSHYNPVRAFGDDDEPSSYDWNPRPETPKPKVGQPVAASNGARPSSIFPGGFAPRGQEGTTELDLKDLELDAPLDEADEDPTMEFDRFSAGPGGAAAIVSAFSARPSAQPAQSPAPAPTQAAQPGPASSPSFPATPAPQPAVMGPRMTGPVPMVSTQGLFPPTSPLPVQSPPASVGAISPRGSAQVQAMQAVAGPRLTGAAPLVRDEAAMSGPYAPLQGGEGRAEPSLGTGTMRPLPPNPKPKSNTGTIIAVVGILVVLVLLGGVLAFLIPRLLDQRDRAQLRFQIDDAKSVEITVDDQLVYKGSTDGDILVQNLEPGRRTIAVSSPGFQTKTDALEIKPGGDFLIPIKLDKALDPTQTGVSVKVEPDGAEVLLDGAKVDEPGPFSRKDLKPGAHKLIFRKKGYKEVIREFDLKEGERKDFEVKLELASFDLSVESPTPGAEAEVFAKDERSGPLQAVRRGPTPLSLSGLDAARFYEVEIRAPGYVARRESFQAEGPTRRVSLDLTPEAGTVPGVVDNGGKVEPPKDPKVDPPKDPKDDSKADARAEAAERAKAEREERARKEREERDARLKAEREERLKQEQALNGKTDGKPDPKDGGGEKDPPASGFGSVTVASKPQGLVFIDGQQVGYTPIASYRLPVGTHRVTIKIESLGTSNNYTVQIKPNENARIVNKPPAE